jgi:hypothetical protein
MSREVDLLLEAASAPTIPEIKSLQRRLDMRDTHIVWIGPSRFVIAHTDEERATIDLEDCELHAWLHGLGGPPTAYGYYTALRHEPDAYSESYRADPWDLCPLDVDAGTAP